MPSSMTMEKYGLNYINEFGEKCHVDFRTHEYHSLMELLFDKYVEEWGDCKGRAWCGTCHIQIIEGLITQKMDEDEKNTLSKISNTTAESRLACQIPVTPELNGLVFRIVGDM